MKIAVIGAGNLGRSFTLLCARAGFRVVLEDVMPHKLRQAGVECAGIGNAVALVSTVEDAVCDADLVVDFVPDELESKLEIWSLLDRMAPPRTILCTPSDVLSITDLASCTYRADRCVMARGILAIGESVRLLRAFDTSDETIACTSRLFSAIGLYPTVEADPDLPMLLKNMHAAML